ncbi:Hpt domain-containing protein [Porifericola rhodea]|uniref:Hpt domain-containing protein n=1 Tax=Porifericola rhodea TaxID=930972 RepID=UPI0026668CB3|nr:Hpt domain-containing protein [Porifericola rhodea]WKN29933.1 Hpt domain-containing protein [Porifericola rhodea]
MSNEPNHNENIEVLEQVDLSYMKEISDGDSDFIEAMVSSFVSEMPEMLYLLNIYLKSKDWEGMSKLAHKIKPSIQFMGLNKSYEIIKSIEQNGKNNDGAQISDQFPLFLQTIEEAISTLKGEQIS